VPGSFRCHTLSCPVSGEWSGLSPPTITEPRELSGLERLTKLNLGGTGVRDLVGLRDVPAVTRLDLGGCARLSSLAGIDAMPELTELVLEDCPRLKTVDGFGTHAQLTELAIKNCAGLADLSAVSSLTNLTQLWLYRLDLLHVHGLKPVPNLRNLLIQACDGLTDLGGLGRHGRLTRLTVTGCAGLRTFGDLSGLTALRELEIGHCPALTDLDHLGSLPALNRVGVMYCPELTDVTGLAGSPAQRVSFFDVPKLTSLRALDLCPGLRDLEVKNCPEMQDLPAGPLDSLSLGNLEWADLGDLAGRHELRVLKFGFMGKLKDISLLSTMPALEEIDLGATFLEDFRPLLDLPSLERLEIPRHTNAWDYPHELFVAVMNELKARGVSVRRR
jgi:Leucine-rich repeat (LRR) protein